MNGKREYPYTLSSILLDYLVRRDTTYLFGVAGSAERDLFDNLARDEYKDRITFIQANSEHPAARMSIGYARASEKVAPLILHVQAGPANAALPILDAYVSKIPLLIFSVGHISRADDFKEALYGYYRTPELLREYCKHVYRIIDASNADKIIRRALRLAEMCPSGPVFLTVSQDIIEAEAARRTVKETLSYNPSPPEDSLRAVATSLKRAEKPAILAQRTRRRESVHLLVDLAERLGAAVFETRPSYMNFPCSHPLHQGYLGDEASMMKEYIQSCDLILALDCFNPPVAESALNIHVSDNPLSFNEEADINLFCSTETFLKSIVGKLKDIDPSEDRIEKLRSRHKTVREKWGKALEVKFNEDPASPQRLWFEVNRIFNGGRDYVVFFAPGFTQRLSVLRYLERDTPGCFYSSLSAAMGGAGEAIGVQLAETRRVICGLGDFEAHVAQLPTLLWTCSHHRIPVIWVVLDNATGAIVKRSYWNYGKCMRDKKVFVGIDLDTPRTDWVKIAEANNVEALRCEHTEELRDCLDEAVGAKGPVLLSVHTQVFEEGLEGLSD
ncbi:MAG: thiamine pyrophosphate-binding protein [Candidatus Bathyarchaeia archaeon]